jgi:hypothetical protein
MICKGFISVSYRDAEEEDDESLVESYPNQQYYIRKKPKKVKYPGKFKA